MALRRATTAVNCTAVGFEAVHGGDGSLPLTGQGMVGVGFQALYESVGDFNTAVGTSAARVTTGARNTALGTNALNQLLTGSDNIGIGYAAGLANLGSGTLPWRRCGRKRDPSQRDGDRYWRRRDHQQHVLSRHWPNDRSGGGTADIGTQA
ncbi:hypothetical protein AB5I41_31425 [Sphingomonas sp. MMS24-JH45]